MGPMGRLKIVVHMRRVERLRMVLPMFACVPPAVRVVFSVLPNELLACQAACARASLRPCECAVGYR